MPTREQIVAEARRWLDTPFIHQGRQMGIGVDCVGVLFGVAWALGLSDFDYRSYHPRPNTDTMSVLLCEHLTPIHVLDARAGDVLHMHIGGRPQHVGILTAHDTLLHAYQHVGRCVEHRLDDKWWARVRGAYQFPGVID